ncbi:hypothetical protein RB595_005369 [Gaeumannomyces hyphopodioides]
MSSPQADVSSAPGATLRQGGDVDFLDGLRTMATQRKNMTQERDSRAQHGPQHAPKARRNPDFLDLVSIVCDIYQSYLSGLIPVQHFHPSWEQEEDAGNTSIVTSRSISSPVQSLTKRGKKELLSEKVIVKRIKKTLDNTKDSALGALINELLIRSHPSLRSHPNIVDLKGIAWDFEKDDEDRPRPLIVEEFAPHRSLTTFWSDQNMVRMPFKAKANLCRDIAEGISALHACGVVHGDLKPGNILIFPADTRRGPFTAKLTDFGSSVCRFEGRQALPAWTPRWCAPEADGEDENANGEDEKAKDLTFDEMMATDVYSYGLVAASIVIGSSVFSGKFLGFKDAATIAKVKAEDQMVKRAMDVVIREDRMQLDSDFDLAVVNSLLGCCLRKVPSDRSLPGCLDALISYEESLYTAKRNPYFTWKSVFTSQPIEPPRIGQPPLIGYRTLSGCGHSVKAKIVAELKKAASNTSDRQAACAWELCICHFNGFGVEKNWEESRYWLARSAMLGLGVARAFFLRIHHAMAADPLQSLTAVAREGEPTMALNTDADAVALISKWLSHVVSLGCVEVLPDLKRLHESQTEGVPLQDGLPPRVKALTTYRKSLAGEVMQCTGGSAKFLEAAVLGDLDALKKVLPPDQDASTQVDAQGNTALILAAKSGNFEVLDLILQQPINAGVCNAAGQSALHFLSIFEDDQIRNLVPRLVDAGADVSREGQPVVQSTKLSTFSVAVRSSPLVYAIIRNNMVLLEELLAASHSEKHVSSCQVCEAGSRYRKTLAVAVSLHCYRGITKLQEHLKKHDGPNKKSLHSIEVWYQDEPMHLHRVPFDGYVLRGLDLPEGFLRAIYHGQDMSKSVGETLDILLDRQPVGGSDNQKVYDMIQEATTHDGLEALEHLLGIGFNGTDELLRFSLLGAKDFYNNPVFTSIRLGNRAVFKQLVSGNGQGIQPLDGEAKCDPECRHSHHRDFRRHPINMAQQCLSVAVTASHFDQFFVNFILDHSFPGMILARPSTLDEMQTGQPASFMAQAIFASARVSAATLVAKYPALLTQQVKLLHPDRRLKKSQSYTTALNRDILGEDVISWRTFQLPELIFFIGSEADCKLLQELRMRRAAQIPAVAARRPRRQCTELADNGAMELGQAVSHVDSVATQDWRDHALTTSELHWLMTGLIADRREDRPGLWDLVRHQYELPQHKSAKGDSCYIRLAVMYSNHGALMCLREQGWALGKRDFPFGIPPLFLAKYVAHSKLSFPITTSTNTAPRFDFSLSRLSRADDAAAKKTVTVLRESGCWSWPVSLDSRAVARYSPVAFMVLHFIVLPLAIGAGCVAPRPSVEGWKWLWLCGWSLSTLFNTILLYKMALKHSLLLTPWACYSYGFFRLRHIAVRSLTLPLCLFFIVSQYLGAVPMTLYSDGMLDIPFFKPYLALVIILAAPTLTFLLWKVLLVLQALREALNGIFVTIMALQHRARL